MSFVMPEIVDPADDNAAMRSRSGAVNDHRRLVAFLYLILRDHVVPGAVEELLQDLAGVSGPFEFTNGYLARYAQDVAARLYDDDPDAALKNLAGKVQRVEIENDAEPPSWAMTPGEFAEGMDEVDATKRAIETAIGRAREERVPVYIRPGEAGHLLRIRCNLCGAGNPDARRLLDEEHGERQHCFNCRTVLEALPESLPEELPEPAGPDEEPCGASDPSGRLICVLPAGHEGPHGAEGTL